MMKISDIVNKEFSRSFMGYDMREVDFFLDEIIEQLETYERERQEMLTAMEYLLRELEQFDDIADDAEKQLRHPEAPQEAAVPPENRTRHTVRVHPTAASLNPDGEPIPADVAETEPVDVLEELEIDEESARAAEPDDAVTQAPQAADVLPEYGTDRTVRVHPAAAPVNPDGDPIPAADAETEPVDVLEELELDGEPARTAEPDDLATQAPQATAVPPEYGTDRTVRAHPAAAPINPDGELAPADDTETVLEARTQEPLPEQAPAVPDGEESADEAPAATEQPQAADDPTGKELH